MVRALEADLFALKSRPTTAPGTRPETSSVDVPHEVEEARMVDDGTHDEENERARDVTPSPSPVVTPAPVPHFAPDENVDDAPAASGADSSTREVDVRTLFEQSKQRAGFTGVPATPANPIGADAQAAPHMPAPGPIDLLGNDGGDADVLDDDAFFATLRDAVHDDAPLGPRDDDEPTGDHRLFDQDEDRGGFRDVFRRRR